MNNNTFVKICRFRKDESFDNYHYFMYNIDKNSFGDFWHNVIKPVIKELCAKHKNHKCYVGELTKNLLNKLNVDEIPYEGSHWSSTKWPKVDFYVMIDIDNYGVEFIVKNNILSGIDICRKRYDFDDPPHGNCIDKFIANNIRTGIDFVDSFAKSIEKRWKERTNIQEYHQTNCYEKDFAQLISIRDVCKKMLDSCNKELELMSEKYTKLN